MKTEYKLLSTSIISFILTITAYFKIHDDFMRLKYIKLFDEPIDYLSSRNQLLTQFNVNEYGYIMIIAFFFILVLIQIDLTFEISNKIKNVDFIQEIYNKIKKEMNKDSD